MSETRLLDLLDGVIYADCFDCAVTFDEIWRYARTAIEPEQLRRLLRDDGTIAKLLVEDGGLYCFADRPELIGWRAPRLRRSRRLQRRAQRIGRVLRHFPFVRALALTGSVAADNAAERADIDLLVVVAAERLGTAFLLLGAVSRLLGRRFCPNYYLSEGRCALDQRSLYVARELGQLRSLVGDAATVRESNPWLEGVFPNARGQAAAEPRLRPGSLVQRLLEAPLRTRAGNRLERRARRIALDRLRVHYGAYGLPVPPGIVAALADGAALRFHGLRYDDTALERYAARRAEVAARLAPAQGDGRPVR